MEAVFKRYDQDQQYLLPPSLEDLIPSNHLVRVVNEAVEKMDLKPLVESYIGGGASSYHPKMLLKALIYGYVTKTYSSRRIAKSLRENINFMWLSGNNRPDFRTINNFRSSRLKEYIDSVFGSTLELLLEAKLIKLEDYFQDGTTIEADANKHSYVWKKKVKRNKLKVESHIKELIKKIDQINEKEEKQYGNRDLEEMGEESTISSEKIKEKVEEINKKIKSISEKKKVKQQETIVRKLTRDYIPKLEKYEEHEKNLGDRNNYSRTDVDATFMRLKSNGYGNRELKPGYNIQIGTEGQYIVNFSVHQNSSDTANMISHLEKLKDMLKPFRKKTKRKLPLNIIADAGYGSEENYQYLETEKVNAYVKYNTFDIERLKKNKSNRFRVENLLYDDQKDEYICPANKPLKYLTTVELTSKTGYTSSRKIYQSESCNGCELRSLCHKSQSDRRIQVSHKLNGYRTKARELLETDAGKIYRKRRGEEVEAVFGNIKRNRGFRRFSLRGIKKVNTEMGLISVAHNLIKWGISKLDKESILKLAVVH